MFVVVMVETAYGWDALADYPDLAGKANYPVLGVQPSVHGIPCAAPSMAICALRRKRLDLRWTLSN